MLLQLCRRCGIGIDTDGDGNCPVCAHVSDYQLQKLKESWRKINMDPLFQVHRLNEVGLKKAEAIAFAFNELLNRLRELCPEPTREFSVVKTKLEEACFFAKKSIANVPANQQE